MLLVVLACVLHGYDAVLVVSYGARPHPGYAELLVDDILDELTTP